MYGEGVRGMGQEPGFMVVKKYEVSESAVDEPITDLNVKEWEVGSSSQLASHVCSLCFIDSVSQTWINQFFTIY